MSFFIRKLNAHELGYRKGIPKKAGRYIVVSKKIKDFFPEFPENVKKPHLTIGLINNETKTFVATEFGHHTGSLHRGEDKRFYLKKDFDPHSAYFNAGDYVIFNKEKYNEEYYYRVYKFISSNKEYDLLEKLCDNQTHFYTDTLPFELKSSGNFSTISISSKTKSFYKRIKRTDEDTCNSQDEFKLLVRSAYGMKCAISGLSINTDKYTNLQAAHIKPHSPPHKGPLRPDNGILMSLDIHYAFDSGLFTINDDLTIKVHSSQKEQYLSTFDGKKIFKVDEEFSPNIEYLQYHQSNIFGRQRHLRFN